MFSHRFHFLMRDSPTDFTHRSYGAFKGVHLSPLGFAACQSKKFTNTTKSIFSHRIQNRTFLLGILPQISQNTQNFLAEIFSHKFHRSTQNFLAGIFSHRFHRTHRTFLLRYSPTDLHRTFLLGKIP